VRFVHPDSAHAAVRHLDGAQLPDGGHLNVQFSTSALDRASPHRLGAGGPGARGGGAGGGGGLFGGPDGARGAAGLLAAARSVGLGGIPEHPATPQRVPGSASFPPGAAGSLFSPAAVAAASATPLPATPLPATPAGLPPSLVGLPSFGSASHLAAAQQDASGGLGPLGLFGASGPSPGGGSGGGGFLSGGGGGAAALGAFGAASPTVHDLLGAAGGYFTPPMGGRLSPGLVSPGHAGLLGGSADTLLAPASGNGRAGRACGGGPGGGGGAGGGDGSFFSRRQAQLLEQQQQRQQRGAGLQEPAPAVSGPLGGPFSGLGGGAAGLPSPGRLFDFGPSASEGPQAPGLGSLLLGGSFSGGGGALPFGFGPDTSSLAPPSAAALQLGGAFDAGGAAAPAGSAGLPAQLGSPFSFLPPMSGPGAGPRLGLGPLGLGLGQGGLAAALEDPELLARLQRVRGAAGWGEAWRGAAAGRGLGWRLVRGLPAQGRRDSTPESSAAGGQ
jgi:hypothetical protein